MPKTNSSPAGSTFGNGLQGFQSSWDTYVGSGSSGGGSTSATSNNGNSSTNGKSDTSGNSISIFQVVKQWKWPVWPKAANKLRLMIHYGIYVWGESITNTLPQAIAKLSREMIIKSANFERVCCLQKVQITEITIQYICFIRAPVWE